MIRSMTAYAGAELTRSQVRVEMEIRGYNSRNLDMAVKLPPGYQFLEEKIRSVVAGQITRGRVEIRLSIHCEASAEEAFQINEAAADGYYAALRRLAGRFQISEDIPLSLLAAKSGIIEPAQTITDEEAVWQAVSETLFEALNTFTEMKITEGRHTEQDLENRLAVIEKAIGDIENRASDLLDIYQQRLKERIHSLTQGMIDIDEARIAQEAAILADKSDISEEINRSRSHLNQFRQLMEAPDPAGRPLNFLLQEFNREFNTMGSKVGSAAISHVIVSAKTELEKIREQVQNIE